MEELREGMKSHWKRELKAAERNRLEIMTGTGQELFDAFIQMYREMVSRKRFVEPNDIHQFRLIQKRLPEPLKMKIMLCRSGAQLCAGVISSAMGNTAMYLFGATSNAGMKTNGSYLLQWKLIEELKRRKVSLYNLNGVNPTKNPGTYKFKDDLAGSNGRHVGFLGRFDANGNILNSRLIQLIDVMKMTRRPRKRANSNDRVLKFE
jgi:lipid II:glycine glycyltransferase (peptidoglycan interpeptide bridge formation enzyme)